MRTHLSRAKLDHALAAGSEPWASPELSVRARELTDTRTRRKLAIGVERAVDQVDVPQHRRGAAAPLNRQGIRHCRPLLLEVANELCDPEPPSPQGVALIEELLCDGTSPLYSPGDERELEQTLRRARAALMLRPE